MFLVDCSASTPTVITAFYRCFPFPKRVVNCPMFFYRLFGIKCARCSVSFTRNDFVMRARNKIYHVECFRCVTCSRQLLPGDEFALREDGLFCRADNDCNPPPPVEKKITPNGTTNGQHNGTTNGTSLQMAGKAHQFLNSNSGQFSTVTNTAVLKPNVLASLKSSLPLRLNFCAI